jgi:hypothetical protein
MDIKQGFSMSFKPVDGESELYDLKLYTHLSINEKVVTRDLIFGMFVELDNEWAQKIPADQFAVLATEVASQVVTAQYPADQTEQFRKDIAQAIKKIVNPLLGE